MSKSGFLIRACLLLCSFISNVAQGDEVLKVGVRADATSMSYKLEEGILDDRGGVAGPLRKKGYSGYIIYLCDQVLSEMKREYDFEVEVIELTASKRFEMLGASSIDILCDPTTATKNRLAGLISSSPIFLSGLSYASRPTSKWTECASLLGFIRGTTSGMATSGISTLLKAGQFPRHRVSLQKFLEQDKSWVDAFDCQNDQRDLVVGYETHLLAAKDFCADKIHFYIGDHEIVTKTLQSVDGCEFEISDRTFTDERHVILGKQRETDNINFLVGLFFEKLSVMTYFEPSVLDEAFTHTFPMSKKSEKLRTLFWSLRGKE